MQGWGKPAQQELQKKAREGKAEEALGEAIRAAWVAWRIGRRRGRRRECTGKVLERFEVEVE